MASRAVRVHTSWCAWFMLTIVSARSTAQSVRFPTSSSACLKLNHTDHRLGTCLSARASSHLLKHPFMLIVALVLTFFLLDRFDTFCIPGCELSHLLKLLTHTNHRFRTFCLSAGAFSHLLKFLIHADRRFVNFCLSESASCRLLKSLIHADRRLALPASQPVRLPTSWSYRFHADHRFRCPSGSACSHLLKSSIHPDRCFCTFFLLGRASSHFWGHGFMLIVALVLSACQLVRFPTAWSFSFMLVVALTLSVCQRVRFPTSWSFQFLLIVALALSACQLVRFLTSWSHQFILISLWHFPLLSLCVFPPLEVINSCWSSLWYLGRASSHLLK